MKEITENWKPVLGYEGLYEVSDFGHVKSLIPIYGINERILSPGKNSGYFAVNLWKSKERKTFFIHRLVYEAFNGKIPRGMQVNHINEIKTDNRLCNLNLLSPKENINWGTGVQRSAETRSKPIIAYDKKTGNLIKKFKSLTEASKWLKNPWSHAHICTCLKGRRPSAYGYIWKYV